MGFVYFPFFSVVILLVDFPRFLRFLLLEGGLQTEVPCCIFWAWREAFSHLLY